MCSWVWTLLLGNCTGWTGSVDIIKGRISIDIRVVECEKLLATQRAFKPPSGLLGAKPTVDLTPFLPLPSNRRRRVLFYRFDNLKQRLMSAVDAAAIRSDRHLFAHGSARLEEPPTVSPNEVVISSPYSPGAIHPSVLDEDVALHHDKDFEPLDLSHDPSIQPGESTAASSIQVLDDVPDHIGVTIEDMVSSDDSQDWTEGDSQEHKRVKVRLHSAPQPIPPIYPDFLRFLHAALPPSRYPFLCSVLSPKISWIHSLTQLQGLRARGVSLGGPRHCFLLRAFR